MFLLIPRTLGAGKGREWEGKGGQLVEFFAEYARHKLGHGVERRERNRSFAESGQVVQSTGSF